MFDQFQRTALLIGQNNIDILKNRRVAVFGIGGVGGHAAEALCRCGVGMIDVYDGDTVDVTNINRQLIATQKTIGLPKVEVMQTRLLEINPHASVNAHRLFYLPDTADSVDLSLYDHIIDAVDTMTAKLELVTRAASAAVPMISSMGEANKLDPTAFEVADIYETSVCPMARIMRRELRKRNIEKLKVVYSKEEPRKIENEELNKTENEEPCKINNDESNQTSEAQTTRPLPASISFVPPVVGLILAGEVIKDLLH